MENLYQGCKMKRLFALLLALTLIFCAFAEEEDENIIRLQTDPPTYLKYDEIMGAWNLYDETGVIDFEYYIYDYKENGSPFIVSNERGCGFLSMDGRWIFEPQFHSVDGFMDNGLAVVEVGDKWGLVTLDGEYLFEPQFSYIGDFRDGIAAVEISGNESTLWGYITENGDYLFEPQFIHAEDFNEGFAVVGIAYSDADSHLVPFDELDDSYVETTVYGYVTADGNWFIEPQFEWADDFDDGMARVSFDGMFGFIGTDGQYFIEPRFEVAWCFEEDLSAVTEDGEKWGFIDKQGNWVIEPKYASVKYDFCHENGLAVVYSEYGEQVLIDIEGNELLKGTRIEFTGDDLVYVERNKYEGYFRITENGPEEVTVVETDMYLHDYYPFEGEKVAMLDHEAVFERDRWNAFPRLDGATALLPVYAALAQAVYPDDTRYENYSWVNNREPLFTCTKTNTAYDRLVDGETDIIFCAEPSDQQIKYARQNGVEFEYTLFGYESFVFIVNPENPLDGLTVDQIKEIYSGELTTWDELGVEGLGEIIPYQRPKNSGSQTALEKLMGDTPIMEAPQVYVSDGMTDILKTIEYRNLPNAIGYTFRFFCADMVGSKVKLLAINGVEPTVENISNGKYPIITPLYAVTRKGESNPNVKRLLDFLTDLQGQELVEKSGDVGLGN